MREFGSLGEMAVHLAGGVVAVRVELERVLEKALVRIEQTAREELGVYQPETGPFPAWAELTEETQASREAAGFTPNDPLLRSGDLRDSLGHTIDRVELDGQVGVTSEVGPYMEFGTSRVPPRPFLGPAGYRNVELVAKLAGAAVMAGLIGRDQVHAALGYDIDVLDERG